MVSVLPVVATLSLIHAGYSSYEYALFKKTHASTVPFPRDIQLEILITVTLYLIHFFLTVKSEKTLSLVDVGRTVPVSKLRPILMKDAVVEDEIKGANLMFKPAETRVGFIDILNKREEYAEWEAREKE
jgi:hypothetical protein